MMTEPTSQVEANLSEMMWIKPTAQHKESILQILVFLLHCVNEGPSWAAQWGSGVQKHWVQGSRANQTSGWDWAAILEAQPPGASSDHPCKAYPHPRVMVESTWGDSGPISKTQWLLHGGSDGAGAGSQELRVPTSSAVVQTRVGHWITPRLVLPIWEMGLMMALPWGGWAIAQRALEATGDVIPLHTCIAVCRSQGISDPPSSCLSNSLMRQ